MRNFFKKTAILSAAIVLRFLIGAYRKFKPLSSRIYFFYNQSIHQIYHSLFVAIELSNIQDAVEVCVFSTSHDASVIIEEELALIPHRIFFRKIKHLGYYKTDFNVDWFVFHCRVRMHRPLAIVVTDYFDNVFRQMLLKTFWVYIPHGAANREYSFEKHLSDYDLAILPGEKDLKEFERRIGPLKNSVVGGYPKLDYFRYHPIRRRILFKEDLPIVLYNPHFDEKLTSFFDKGRELLEALSGERKFNVILMPHPDLSRNHPGLIKELRGIPRVALIERPKINLEYMSLADIYVTDVSSSVYEWLYFDKPAVFFNSKNVDWKKSGYYLSWVLGPVVTDLSEMLKVIQDELAHPDHFRDMRKKMFAEVFQSCDEGASKKIAGIIWDRIKDGK